MPLLSWVPVAIGSLLEESFIRSLSLPAVVHPTSCFRRRAVNLCSFRKLGWSRLDRQDVQLEL